MAGVISGRPAIDLHERKSNEKTAFPASVVTIISRQKDYLQSGADGIQARRVRFECFALSAGSSILLSRSIIGEMECAALVGGVQFAKSQLIFERSFNPEDIGPLRVFRTLIDINVQTNS